MTAQQPSIDALTDLVEQASVSGTARAATARWQRRRPELAGFGDTPALIACNARCARLADMDTVLRALMAEAPGDEWAQLTVMAILAPRMRWVVSGWARHPGARSDLADLEAELVGEVWVALACQDGPPPARPGLAVVDRAWAGVRDRRARQRRRAEVLAPRDRAATIPAHDGRSGLEVLAAEIAGTVAAGRISLAAARALYLTRVAGLSTVEAAQLMATHASSVRALRSAAARRLTA